MCNYMYGFMSRWSVLHTLQGWEDDAEQQSAASAHSHPWLALLGSAFRAITRLQLFATESTCLETSFFLGLSVCPRLARLEMHASNRCYTPYKMGYELACCPQLLRLWLPHVTQLSIAPRPGHVPLLQGLGAALTHLSVCR